MRRSVYRPPLATYFTQPQLSTAEGTIFVAPRPVDLEAYFRPLGPERDDDDLSLSAFERLLDAGAYALMLSLSWTSTVRHQTLDLGLLRAGEDQSFVIHQVNDDAGTALIIAYLSSATPTRLVAPFLVDYLSSRGSTYMVQLPDTLPGTIWVARPDIASQRCVAAGLLGLVSAGALATAS